VEWIAQAIAVFVAAALLLYSVGIYNGIVRLGNNIDQAWSNIDVLLKQRSDEIPKLVETVKGYMAHEREVLTRVIEARAAQIAALGMTEQCEADTAIRGAVGHLFAVAEAYPEFEADSSFQRLQVRISELEERIADRREFYNDSVSAFNIRIEQLPDMILARWMRLVPRELFAVRAAERLEAEVSL